MSAVDIVISDHPTDVVADLLAARAHAGGHIVLTGGSTPKRAYELAAGLDPDWSRVELWWGDERCVPPDDERSNFGMAKHALLDRLDKQPDKSKTMMQLAKWLQARNVKFQANITTQTAEQLPMEIVARIHRMKDGDLLIMPRGGAISVSQLDKSQNAPLTEEQSGPYIEQFLMNRKRMDLSTDEVKRLRAAAKIQYIGDFAPGPGRGEEKSAAPAAQVAPGAQPLSATKVEK